MWSDAFLVDSSFEGDDEGVEGRLSPGDPSCPSSPGGVKRTRHEIQTFQGGLLIGEVPTGSDRAPVAGVEGLDRVGRVDHLADLHVVEPVAEWFGGTSRFRRSRGHRPGRPCFGLVAPLCQAVEV